MNREEIAKINGLFEKIDALEQENARLKDQVAHQTSHEQLLGEIVEIKDHETQVEIVSQQENMASINGKIAELVVGS